ncbi:putative glucan 1,3-beta-glucosidase D [Psilocybe cubensis]|uniref:glucan 1,3-beta-glucosidase n=2 Tax=Psilocybe cubensis TaxID=181762 RepID=A0A8H7XP17_PSICU|nr:putative glucan 1,3-beta-glucosidase D [Psilocybe cubensis]KAH9477953.1 putative glucan 1,3-beta-glucosidase D [Psilocybe cubensis]
MGSERPFGSAPQTSSDIKATYAPLPLADGSNLLQPQAPFAADNDPESPRDSYAAQSSVAGSQTLFPIKNERDDNLENASPVDPYPTPKRMSRKLIVGAIIALIVIILAIVLSIYFAVVKPRSKSSSSTPAAAASSSIHGSVSPTSTSDSAKPSSSATAEELWGGDGSTVKASDGSTFTYNNKFGGIWYSDPSDPFKDYAYPNSWTPPLNQSWDFEKDRIFGVNLGGWLVLEPFISPELFQRYPGAVDEWTLSTLMAADTANGGLNQLEEHYKTFITEQDIAEIAGAGLNWIRLPIPFWAIDTWGDEPFLAKTSWKYFVQALQWCKKYGIRVKLDLHTIPGSHNAYNHSGKMGQINFLYGVMGMANAQRTLNYLRIITQFISQPEYKDVVIIFGIMNEALVSQIGTEEIRAFYVEAYKIIRGITGYGAGNGPYISIHDGFQTLARWPGFLQGADRVMIDSHPYMAFDGVPALDPIDTGTGPGAGGEWPQRACTRWAGAFNASRNAFGVTVSGEFSNGINDCGLFLRGVRGRTSYGGNCQDWMDSSTWSAGTIAGLLAFSSASMDAFRDYFFWTWKIGESNKGIVEAPLWSYKLGLERGWMPKDPRTVIGACGPPTGPSWGGKFESWMTGGAGAGSVPIQTAQYPWPPAQLADGNVVSQLPLYTSTGTPVTLPMPTFTDSNGQAVSVTANGWFNPNDNGPAPTPIAGCSYPDPWNANGVPIPAGCGAGGLVSRAQITPPPVPRSF